MKKSRDNQDNERSGWCLWEWGKEGMCGINGDGTWVVSTKCCAAEVDPQCFPNGQNCQKWPNKEVVAWVWRVAISGLSAHWAPRGLGGLGYFGSPGGGEWRLSF